MDGFTKHRHYFFKILVYIWLEQGSIELISPPYPFLGKEKLGSKHHGGTVT